MANRFPMLVSRNLVVIAQAVDVSDIFFFFCSGAGEKRGGVRGGGRGGGQF